MISGYSAFQRMLSDEFSKCSVKKQWILAVMVVINLKERDREREDDLNCKSIKAGLKINEQKTKIMFRGPVRQQVFMIEKWTLESGE